MITKKINVSSPVYLMILSLLGFVLGVVTVVIWQEQWMEQYKIINEELIDKIQNIYVDKRALLFLCLGKRLRAFFVLFIMLSTSLGLVFLVSVFVFYGFAVGSIMELWMLQFGLKGFFSYMTLTLPHGFFYMLGYFMVGCWYLKRRKEEIEYKSYDFWKIGIALVLLLVGIWLESALGLNFFFLIYDV